VLLMVVMVRWCSCSLLHRYFSRVISSVAQPVQQTIETNGRISHIAAATG